MIPYKFKGTAMPTNGILAQLTFPVYTYMVAHLPFDVNWKEFVLQNFYVINFCVKILIFFAELDR